MIIELLLSLLPGLFIVLIFFKKEDFLTKCLIFILSNIMIMTLLGLVLGFNELTYKITGGLTKKNLIRGYFFVNLVLLMVYFMKSNLRKQFFPSVNGRSTLRKNKKRNSSKKRSTN
ncbi:hypothetical protein HN789_01945 [archaeon]|jgi:glucan phosphoethanolaminetransferase (alkaline phosphatase superfamily)|nr:hypothetical protein [archaeon]MBT4021823.1 hypothetical protein [archaeon]MBT4272118.1 hypothetical protein [archaeon]MBT4460299.1 hypothetical protein [archaeon]MBT4858923.1 hypothetical protein [archaeon]